MLSHSPYLGRRVRLGYPKGNECNFVAAFFHMSSIVLLFSSCLYFGWFRVYSSARCASHLSLSQFFTVGYFEINSPEHKKLPNGDVLVTPMNYHTASAVLPCITPEVVNLIRTIIMLCIIAISSSVVGFCLDVIGPKRKLLCFIRRNGIPSVITVLIIVAAIGVCYLTMKALKLAVYSANPHAVIQVTYASGCYLIAIAVPSTINLGFVAYNVQNSLDYFEPLQLIYLFTIFLYHKTHAPLNGSFSILACACNILQPTGVSVGVGGGGGGDDVMAVVVQNGLRHRLVDEWDGPETFSVGMSNMPAPPPPYTP